MFLEVFLASAHDFATLVAVRLSGRCMEPFLIDGDTAYILLGARPRVGDICLLGLDHGARVLHRVVAEDGRGFLTKGDRTLKAEFVEKDKVLGRVKAVRLVSGSIAPYSAAFLERRLVAKLSLGLCRAQPRSFYDWTVRRLLMVYGHWKRRGMAKRGSGRR